jgi:hypothetical protein
MSPREEMKKVTARTGMSCAQFVNPLPPELHPSAQDCLTRFLTGDFAS